MYIEVDSAEKIARAAILSLSGVGTKTLRYLLADFGCAREALQAPVALSPSSAPGRANKGYADFFRQRDQIDLARTEETLDRLGISLTVPGERTYPALLSTISDVPPILFYQGILDGQKQGIAIVGARRATAYGKSVAHFLGKEVAERGLVVISGLARGIDGAAHEGALAAGAAGVTWAYLGGGLDTLYPAEHKGLAEKILERGALISEYPPGLPTKPGAFPARNRLISGSALGVVVAEAAEKSGALITVDFALEQGREVFAVPGPIFSSVSKGCHNLLRLGAHVVETAEDILEQLPVLRQGTVDLDVLNMSDTPKSVLDQDDLSACDELSVHMSLLGYLSDIPLHIDRLAVKSDMAPQDLAIGLLHLELEGYIQRLPGQHYILDRSHPMFTSQARRIK